MKKRRKRRKKKRRRRKKKRKRRRRTKKKKLPHRCLTMYATSTANTKNADSMTRRRKKKKSLHAFASIMKCAHRTQEKENSLQHHQCQSNFQ